MSIMSLQWRVCNCVHVSTRAGSNCENRQKAKLGNPQLSNQFLAQALWPCQGVKNSYAKMDNVKPLRTLRHSETRLKRIIWIIQMSRSLKYRYKSNQSRKTHAPDHPTFSLQAKHLDQARSSLLRVSDIWLSTPSITEFTFYRMPVWSLRPMWLGF